jgi:GR25 family glycosyltransferase involved in LPS biosynthesis
MPKTWNDLKLNFFILSLKKSLRRRRRIENNFSENSISYHFIDAVDGDDEAATRNAYICDPSAAPRIYVHRKRPVSLREIACTLSHMSAIRFAAEQELKNVIICEDDIEIGDVSASEIQEILDKIPSDAAYIQFCIIPEKTVCRLADFYLETKRLFARKRKDSPTLFEENELSGLSCHSAAAYLITKSGIENIMKTYFRSEKVVFPCDTSEVESNIGLAADRFIYQAASSESNPGYVYCIPTFLIEGVESLLHPDHVPDHLKARKAAIKFRYLAKTK